ncbi:MAG: hypothetical protein ABFD82_20805 [Syntrophaceae bacterium]
MTKKYKKICIAFDTDQHAKAIEILENVPSYWRNDFISDAIVAHNNKRDDLLAKIEEKAKASDLANEA